MTDRSRSATAAGFIRSEIQRGRASGGRGRLAAIFLVGGLLFIAIGVVTLMAALRLNRPDAAIFMRRSIAMTTPLLVTGACLVLAGTYHAFRRRGDET